MSRFVRPETVTLPLSDGDSITVRRWLSEGEQRESYSRMYREGPRGLQVHPAEVSIAMVIAYLVDWTLTDDEGRQVIIRDQPVDVVRAALDALYPVDFAELREAIQAHEDRELEARRQEKKPIHAVLASEVISRSVA